jgi:glycerophosphoryl diester phosphodiesterase
MRRILASVLAAGLALAVFAYLNNSNLLATTGSGKPVLLAHRGVHQTFSQVGLTGATCTAEHIDPPIHPYLENTLASMEAAFRGGADIVELDTHPTADGEFVVFHDWTLDCRTNGTGEVRSQTLATLKALDIGHGYTADGGKTFPFRGQGVGQMPTLDEVLSAFPGKRFLIQIKSNYASEGEQLAARLAQLPESRQADLIVYGGDLPVAPFAARLPAVRSMSAASLRSCLRSHFAIGWTGYVPSRCRHSMILLPINYTWRVWGWPHRFVQRMRDAGTDVYALGPREGEALADGIDSIEEFRRLPAGYSGGIWTNRIDRIAPLTQR